MSARPRRVVVTAGPTREHIDPVRYLTNESSGRMGFAIAAAAARAGHDTTLVAGPVDLATPEQAPITLRQNMQIAIVIGDRDVVTEDNGAR